MESGISNQISCENTVILDDLSLYAEEFTVGRGRTACLLIHGLGGGPIQMRELAETLAPSGITTRGILLPGHCCSYEDLEGVSSKDWYKKVEDEYIKLKEEYEDVAVVGFSLGALLALKLAVNNPVKRVVVMGTPIFIIRRYLPMSGLIKLCGSFLRKVKIASGNWPISTEVFSGCLRLPIYSHFPMSSLLALTNLIDTIRYELNRIRSPILIIHSKRDSAASPSSANYISKFVGSNEKRLVWLEQSHHLIMHDREKETVFSEIRHFLGGEVTKEFLLDRATSNEC